MLFICLWKCILKKKYHSTHRNITNEVVCSNAVASIQKLADVIASWNFKHIVNLDRIKGYNSVNLKLGYQMIEIRSPKDLINYGND